MQVGFWRSVILSLGISLLISLLKQDFCSVCIHSWNRAKQGNPQKFALLPMEVIYMYTQYIPIDVLLLLVLPVTWFKSLPRTPTHHPHPAQSHKFTISRLKVLFFQSLIYRKIWKFFKFALYSIFHVSCFISGISLHKHHKWSEKLNNNKNIR